MPLDTIQGVHFVETVSETIEFYALLIAFVATLLVIFAGLLVKEVYSSDRFNLSIYASGCIMIVLLLVIVIYIAVYTMDLPPKSRIVLDSDADIVTLYQFYDIIECDKYTLVVRPKTKEDQHSSAQDFHQPPHYNLNPR